MLHSCGCSKTVVYSHALNLCKVKSMDDNIGELVECMSVASGCGCKEVYRFPHITYLYSSCICSYWQQHSYFFVHLNKCFSLHFVIKFYVIFLHVETHMMTTGILRKPYERLHIMFYMRRSKHKRKLHIL